MCYALYCDALNECRFQSSSVRVVKLTGSRLSQRPPTVPSIPLRSQPFVLLFALCLLPLLHPISLLYSLNSRLQLFAPAHAASAAAAAERSNDMEFTGDELTPRGRWDRAATEVGAYRIGNSAAMSLSRASGLRASPTGFDRLARDRSRNVRRDRRHSTLSEHSVRTELHV